MTPVTPVKVGNTSAFQNRRVLKPRDPATPCAFNPPGTLAVAGCVDTFDIGRRRGRAKEYSLPSPSRRWEGIRPLLNV
jgi:hypothetical protein